MMKRLVLLMLACLVSHALAGGHGGHDGHDHTSHESHDHENQHGDGSHGGQEGENNHQGHGHGDHQGPEHNNDDHDDDCPSDEDDNDDHSDDNNGNHASHDNGNGNHAGHNHGSDSNGDDNNGNHAGHDHGNHDNGDDDDGNHTGHNHGNHGDDDDDDDQMEHAHHEQGGYDGKAGDCPNMEHSFDGHHWYLKLMGKTPQMQEITICAYVTTDELGMIHGVIGSIHTDKPNKNLVVLGQMHKKKPHIRIILEGQVRNVQRTLPPNGELHMCLMTNRAKNTVTLYLNGKKTRDLNYNRIRGLPPGILMIGRTKDDKFDMYKGKIRNFIMWDKRLTDEEIQKIHEDNYCPGDAKVVLTPMSVVPLKNNVPTEDCPDIDFKFNNTGDNVDYIKLASIGETKFATVCAKVTTDATGMMPGTVASYGTHENPELLAVGGGRDSNGIPRTIFVINGHKQLYPGQYAPSTTYSFCIQYHFPHSHLLTYINGINNKMGMFQGAGLNMLPGGGTIVLGQQQRKQGRCFDRKKAFNGMIADFKFWTRALSDDEIMQYAKGQCPTDADTSLSEEYILPSGDVTFGMCPEAEFTLVNQGNILEYVAVSKTISDTEFLTVCSNITTSAAGAVPGIIASYYTPANVETVVVGGEMGPDGPMIRITINGKTIRSPAQFAPVTNYHFCIQFHTTHDHALTYINGRFSSEYTIKDMGFIPGGGTIIIGQLQGCAGGCFQRDAAYNGKLGRFMAWERFISREEMQDIAENNSCPLDYVIDLTERNANKASSIVAE